MRHDPSNTPYQHSAAAPASLPNEFCAAERLQRIFKSEPEEQKAIFAKIGRIIDEHSAREEKKQEKHPRDNDINPPDALGYPLFFLQDQEGAYHYFIGARKKSKPLGRGIEGTVIPVYELFKEGDQWRLLPEAPPSIAIKIYNIELNAEEKLAFKDSSPEEIQKYLREEFEKQLQQTEIEIKIMADYYEKKCPFQKPLVRDQAESYKIYLPMTYLPGKEAFFIVEDFDSLALCHFSESVMRREYWNLFLKALRSCISVIEAVDLLHKKGYLHCDIKPENFLGEDEFRLIDFGFSKRIHSSSKPGGDRMTSHYAPWEVLRFPRWTVNAEKFALGMTLHCLLGGLDKFEAIADLALLREKVISGVEDRLDPKFLYFFKTMALNPQQLEFLNEQKVRLEKVIRTLTTRSQFDRGSLSEAKKVFEEVLAAVEPLQKEEALGAISKKEPLSLLWAAPSAAIEERAQEQPEGSAASIASFKK